MADPDDEVEEDDEDEDDDEEEQQAPQPIPQQQAQGGHMARNNRRGGNNHGRGGNPQHQPRQQQGQGQNGGNTVGQQARLLFGDMLSSMPPEMIRTVLLLALDEVEKRPGFQQAVAETRNWVTQYVSDDFLKNRILPALIIGANISPILPRELRPVVGNILDDVLNSVLFDAYRNYEHGGQGTPGQARVERPRAKSFLEALNDLYPSQRVDLDGLMERLDTSPEAVAAWQRVRASQLYPRDLDALLAWADRRSRGDVQSLDPADFVKYVDRWLDRVPPPPAQAAAPPGFFGGVMAKFNKVVGVVETFIADMGPPPPPPGAPPALPGPQGPPRRKTFRRY